MICSHLVNLSLLLGAVVSWGIMWPLIRGLKGEWFPESLSESSMKSLNGYKVSNRFSSSLLKHDSLLIFSSKSVPEIQSYIYSSVLQVFISIALILGDGLYNFLKILLFTAANIHGRMKNKNLKPCN